MATNLDKMSDEVAASLILQAIAKEKGVNAVSRKVFGKSALYDIIVNRIQNPGVDDQYVCYTFYAVKSGKAKSAPRILGELVLKDVVSKLLDKAKGDVSSIYALSGDLSGGLKVAQGGWMETDKIYSNASKLGGQMQLHAARKMGKEVYDQARIFGLASNVIYGGVCRFEEVSYGNTGLNIVMSYWNGLSGAASWIDRFNGRGGYDSTRALKELHKFGGDHHVDYIYSPANGNMW